MKFVLVFILTLCLSNAQLNQELRALYQTCIFLGRYYAKENQQNLLAVLQAFPDQESQKMAWGKIYVNLVTHCGDTLTQDESQQILMEMQANSFDFSQHQHIFKQINLSKFKLGSNLEHTAQEKQVQLYIDVIIIQYNILKQEFEQLMYEQQQQQAGGVDKPSQQAEPGPKTKKQQSGQKSDQAAEYSYQFHELLVIASIGFIISLVCYMAICAESEPDTEEQRAKKQRKLKAQSEEYTESQSSSENEDDVRKKQD